MGKFNLLLLSGLLLLTAGCTNESLDLKPTMENGEQTRSNPFRVKIADALDVAEQVRNDLFANGTRTTPIVKSIQTVTTPNTRSNGVDTMYYIVNYADNSGFSVLSADKRLPIVQAISDEGSLSLADTSYNKGLALFFNQLDEQINRLGGITFPPVGPPTTPIDTTIHDLLHPDRQIFKMDPIVHTKVREWHQDEPFNSYCPPLFDYQPEPRCLVGCMALSLGQILSVFEYPTQIGEYSYDWETIKSIHSTPTFRLLAQLGSKDYLNLTYGYHPDATFGAANMFMPTLAKLGYSATEKPGFSNLWAEEKLKSGQPILVSGSFHAWVIDAVYKSTGYDIIGDDGQPQQSTILLFHCVWGYGKQGDGYFNISNSQVSADYPQRTEDGEIIIYAGGHIISQSISEFTHN